jgi:hypothetical protein
MEVKLAMKQTMAAAVLAVLGAIGLWEAFAQTETPCVGECKAKYDECMKEAAKQPDLLNWLQLGCKVNYHRCVDPCRFAQLGTPKTPCEAGCKVEFDECLKEGKLNNCGSVYDDCILQCK